VRLAARGLRDLDGGAETIGDASELAQVRRQARKVWIQSVVVGAVLTVLTLLVPR
jgi:hypothetical protein